MNFFRRRGLVFAAIAFGWILPVSMGRAEVISDQSESAVSPGLLNRIVIRDPRRSQSCRAILHRTGYLLGGAMLLGAGALYLRSEAFAAHRHGRRHLGFGIHYKLSDVLAVLTAQDRAWVLEHRGDSLGLAKFFNEQVYGDYDFHLAINEWFDSEDYGGRLASEFMKGQSNRRGVCRHKALLLEAILQDLGVDAIAMAGFSQNERGGSGHAWVEIPGEDIAIDSTRPWVGVRSDFYAYRKIVGPVHQYEAQWFRMARIPYDGEAAERNPFPPGYPPAR